jgi:hypothetical protein
MLFAADPAQETKSRNLCKLQVSKILIFYVLAVQPKLGRSSPKAAIDA